MRTTQAHRRELVQTLEAMAGPRAGEDRLTSFVFEDVIEANRFLWMEWWPQPEDADAALTGDRIRTLLAAIRVLGTLESVRRVEGAGLSEPTDFRRLVPRTEERDE